ncbi:hypothetical protein K1T71_007425 [Dendrolimus kikuchii]|uniref:Uncharacterized protein n=1 Tax=Dendrolimus kikuchii TaxID=765133 RepID=A0ACC1D0M9_9NEOP|nr:hypothetical protein K1T71_007425 [Dendrolimus kikuchii]
MGIFLRQLNESTIKYLRRCKLLVIGAGTGGCSTVSRFARKLKDNEIIILEPSPVHYYQPMFSLIAAGLKKQSDSCRPLENILPANVDWIKDYADDFDPCNKIVYTKCGHKILYDFMVIAVGLKNDYDKILGLFEALENKTRNVSTIYASKYCTKTWDNIVNFRGGHAIFTYPSNGGKCGGAAQKIMYLADDYWKKHKIRDNINITYNTGGDVLFGVSKYATALQKIVADRNISVNYCSELVEINEREAVFKDSDGGKIILPYNFLHVTPPMSPPKCLTRCKELVTESGYLDVNKYTLQHRSFPDIYGIGDCISTPNSKSAAAVAAQSSIVERNLTNTMTDKPPVAKYNGYGACSILTSYKTGILAEFLYDKRVWETFPFDQSKERRLFFSLQKEYFPYLYWNKVITGKWDGPSRLRNIINPLRRQY